MNLCLQTYSKKIDTTNVNTTNVDTTNVDITNDGSTNNQSNLDQSQHNADFQDNYCSYSSIQTPFTFITQGHFNEIVKQCKDKLKKEFLKQTHITNNQLQQDIHLLLQNTILKLFDTYGGNDGGQKIMAMYKVCRAIIPDVSIGDLFIYEMGQNVLQLLNKYSIKQLNEMEDWMYQNNLFNFQIVDKLCSPYSNTIFQIQFCFCVLQLKCYYPQKLEIINEIIKQYERFNQTTTQDEKETNLSPITTIPLPSNTPIISSYLHYTEDETEGEVIERLFKKMFVVLKISIFKVKGMPQEVYAKYHPISYSILDLQHLGLITSILSKQNIPYSKLDLGIASFINKRLPHNNFMVCFISAKDFKPTYPTCQSCLITPTNNAQSFCVCQCGHIFCKQCLYQAIMDVYTEITNHKENYEINQWIQKIHKPICDYCILKCPQCFDNFRQIAFYVRD